MRSFAIGLLAAFTNAGKVHDFFAESNYICELCKSTVDLAAKGEHAKIEALYQQFPKLEERINYFMDHEELVILSDPLQTCKNIQLCEEFDLVRALQDEEPLNLAAHIEYVNSNPNATWVAGENIKFSNVSRKEARSLMGTVVDPDWAIQLPERNEPLVFADDLPTDFDARTNWAECETVINHVRDQSNCGSCWAHGTTEALNDRMCIATGGSFTTLLSVSDTTGCCGFLACQSMGCNGGQVGTPWKWFSNTGVVTGGDYGTNGTCYNYTMEQCAHHVTSDTLPECDAVTQV